jgi:seryl-tRNA synthetase
VEDFDNVAKDSLDEWIYFLKNNVIPEEFTAKGLPEAREVLQYDDLSEKEKKEYDHHLSQSRYEQNVIEDSIAEGYAKGEKEREKLQQALDEKDKVLEDQKREIEELKRRLGKQ